MQTPLLSLENYWRSGNTSDQLYHCPYLNSCQGYPNFSGADAGDNACKTGYSGPVCQVCINGWYGYSQGCRCAAPASSRPTAIHRHTLAHVLGSLLHAAAHHRSDDVHAATLVTSHNHQ